jgi:hypothetical protein
MESAHAMATIGENVGKIFSEQHEKLRLNNSPWWFMIYNCRLYYHKLKWFNHKRSIILKRSVTPSRKI